MRVISGKYKGKVLEGFTLEGTRPTMDRVKESMFAMLQNEMKDSVVLDLFAGSGSLGIEALSNGAKECYFVDKSKEAIVTIKKNTKGIENAKVIEMDSFLALSNFYKEKKQFDIIFLDPPYHKQLLQKAVDTILDNKLLKEDGLLVCEREEEQLEISIPLWKSKKYGTKTVEIYKN